MDEKLFTPAPPPRYKGMEWIDQYAFVLKTWDDRKVFLDLVERAHQFGKPDSFFQLLLQMLLCQQIEIEKMVDKLIKNAPDHLGIGQKPIIISQNSTNALPETGTRLSE